MFLFEMHAVDNERGECSILYKHNTDIEILRDIAKSQCISLAVGCVNAM